MKINYLSKNYKISSKFKDVLEKKLAKLEKYFPKDYDIKVSCIAQGDVERLEVTINADGLFVRSEVTSDNMYNNIDIAMPKIERQIVKSSQRAKKKFKNIEKNSFEFLAEMPVVEAAPKLVRTKRFELEPITEYDAEVQMDALGHNFFIFLNAKTGLVNVLYRRNDGNLGLIEINY